MSLFIGYGYNRPDNRDGWIEECVFPLAIAFGSEVDHGKSVFGGALPAEIERRIRRSDAMLGFTTQRDEIAPGKFGTHNGVVQELLIAHAQRSPAIPCVEVREEGVISPGGIPDAVDAQRIEYRESDRATCLVRIAQAMRRLRDLTNVVSVRLGPASVLEQIENLLDSPGFSCTCQIRARKIESAPEAIPIRPGAGRLFRPIERPVVRGSGPADNFRRRQGVALVVRADRYCRYTGKGTGKDYWEWSVWIEGPPGELDRVDHVIYILDSTFHDPVRTVGERSTSFLLKARSWGGFTVYAKAMMQDGSVQPLKRELVPTYPNGTPCAA